MRTEKVMSALENSIIRVSGDIRKKKGSVGSCKLNSLAKLINSYNRLLDRINATDDQPGESYYDTLERDCAVRK